MFEPGGYIAPMLRVLGVLVVVAGSSGAWAFPFMVKHDYTSCAACHVDPSGAGQLTTFGRAESERLIRWTPGPTSPAPTTLSNFVWFLALPDAVNLSSNVRFGALVQPGGQPVALPLEKAVDLSATVTIANSVLVHGTVGFGRGDAVAPAIVTPRCDPAAEGACGASFLARTFWVGLKAADGAVLVRGGRLVVPFGLRNIEHVAWVRALTRTDTNVQQELGVSASFNSGNLRGEVMGLAGGFLPSSREGGYSAFGEYAFNSKTTLGLSSLVATALGTSATSPSLLTRHAHGAFFRWGALPSLAVLAEADFLAWQGTPEQSRVGFAALAQADWELVQGLHVFATVEGAHQGLAQHGPSLGAWLSASWYFFSHCELRLDNVLRRTDADATPSYALVAQLHFYL